MSSGVVLIDKRGKIVQQGDVFRSKKALSQLNKSQADKSQTEKEQPREERLKLLEEKIERLMTKSSQAIP